MPKATLGSHAEVGAGGGAPKASAPENFEDEGSPDEVTYHIRVNDNVTGQFVDKVVSGFVLIAKHPTDPDVAWVLSKGFEDGEGGVIEAMDLAGRVAKWKGFPKVEYMGTETLD